MKAMMTRLSFFLLAAPAAWAQSHAISGWEDLTYYQFQQAMLPETDAEAYFGHIDYLANKRVVYSKRVGFKPKPDGTATFVLPDLQAFARSIRTPIEVEVYVGTTLLTGFDSEAFLAYNARLKYNDAANLSEAAQSYVTEEAPSANTKPNLFQHQSRFWSTLSGQQKIDCGSPCGGGCGPHQDYDCDGVSNINDNCTDDHNPGQQDCDGDGYGNVCDGLNANYQPIGPEKTCMTDKDNHVAYKTFEHHVERRQRDVSSCGAPDRWNRRIRSDADCFNISDEYCCSGGIGTSILQVGDNVDLWCGVNGIPFNRNIDFCH